MSIDYRSLANRDVALLMLDSAVRPYFDIMEHLAFELDRLGARVRIVGCGGGLSSCVSLLSAYQGAPLGETVVNEICSNCRRSQSSIARVERVKPNYETGAEEEAFLQDVTERLQRGGTLEAVLDLAFRGLDVCRLAFFDFSNSRKVNCETVLSGQVAHDFVSAVGDQLRLIGYFEKESKRVKTDALLYINGNYSQNQLAARIFARAGVACYSIEPKPTSAALFNGLTLVPGRLPLSDDAWQTAGSTAARPRSRDYNRMLAHFGARVLGQEFNAYTNLELASSDASKLGNLLPFLEKHERIATFFLSSEDELHSHEVTYGLARGLRQIDCVKRFVERARMCPQRGFVVRLHPRMAVNKRNNFESLEHLAYKDFIERTDIPDNVLVLLGDCPVSSYFLVQVSALTIVSWSTIGLEALLLGRPVIALYPERLMYPIAQFNGQVAEQEQIFDVIFGEQRLPDIDSAALLEWMTQTYEAQFQAVPVPRGGSNRLQSRLAERAYRAGRKIVPMGAINAFHRGIQVLDDKTDRIPTAPWKMRQLERYRSEMTSLLEIYGRHLGVQSR